MKREGLRRVQAKQGSHHDAPDHAVGHDGDRLRGVLLQLHQKWRRTGDHVGIVLAIRPAIEVGVRAPGRPLLRPLLLNLRIEKAAPVAAIPFLDPVVVTDGQAEMTVDDGRGLTGPIQRRGDHCFNREAREQPAAHVRLVPAQFVEVGIPLPLHAADRVPLGAAVAHEVQVTHLGQDFRPNCASRASRSGPRPGLFCRSKRRPSASV